MAAIPAAAELASVDQAEDLELGAITRLGRTWSTLALPGSRRPPPEDRPRAAHRGQGLAGACVEVLDELVDAGELAPSSGRGAADISAALAELEVLAELVGGGVDISAALAELEVLDELVGGAADISAAFTELVGGAGQSTIGS